MILFHLETNTVEDTAGEIVKESIPVQETCGNENPTNDSSTQGDPGGINPEDGEKTDDKNGRL